MKECELSWDDTNDGLTDRYTLYTYRNMSYQKLYLEYPCSADDTKPYSLHTQPLIYFYDLLSLVIDKNNRVQSSEHVLFQRNFAHQV